MPVMMDHYLQKLLVDLLRLALWLLILVAIFVPLERLFALHRQQIFRPQLGVDLGYFFLNGLLPGLLLSGPLAMVAWGAHSLFPASVQAAVAAWPLWLRVLAALLVGEIGYYWGHRWAHNIPLLWRFHAIHHSAGQVDFLTNTRAHPVDLAFTRMCSLVPLFALGLVNPLRPSDGLIPVLVLLTGVMWGFFIHANLRWRFGPLEWVITTPGFHHWHHTLSAPRDRNYASMLPWLDRIFGSHYLPSTQWPSDYGNPFRTADSLGGQLLQPFAGQPSAGKQPTMPV